MLEVEHHTITHFYCNVRQKTNSWRIYHFDFQISCNLIGLDEWKNTPRTLRRVCFRLCKPIRLQKNHYSKWSKIINKNTKVPFRSIKITFTRWRHTSVQITCRNITRRNYAQTSYAQPIYALKTYAQNFYALKSFLRENYAQWTLRLTFYAFIFVA